jgi:hypothetical protein
MTVIFEAAGNVRVFILIVVVLPTSESAEEHYNNTAWHLFFPPAARDSATS